MKLPCTDCITLAMCLAKCKEQHAILGILTRDCTIIRKYCLEVGSKVYLPADSELRKLFDCANTLVIDKDGLPDFNRCQRYYMRGFKQKE